MQPTVAVVIPTYNGAAFIEDAIASVFAQSLAPAELIIVDDASRDGTAEIAERITRNSPIPVRVSRLPTNTGGPAQPINAGVRLATSEFIAVLDQDDVAAPSKLQEQATFLAENPGMAVVCSLGARYEEPDSLLQYPDEIEALWNTDGDHRDERCRIRGSEALRILLSKGMVARGFPGFLFRRQDWERKGGVDVTLRIGGDYEMLCWLCTHGDLGFIRKVHYLRRHHGTNMCNDRIAMKVEGLQIRSRFLAGQPWLRDDSSFDDDVRSYFHTLAYWVREGGRYTQAFQCYWYASRVWGWDARTVGGVLRLFPHWLHRSVMRVPPRYCHLTRAPQPRESF
jgi:glycosyltransferase involved in cell wall biosynthesis